ncbi:MAG: hypothetical protein PHO02_01165 [Candidatus Nanoarchaeia archaeon]|nr:hypothetical protein [Candidatus Nanoarchaeia archaeon]
MDKFDGVVAIVFRRGRPDKFALVQNKKTGSVSFPSGAITEGNSMDDTVASLVRAQTGLKADEFEAKQIPVGYEYILCTNTKAERAKQAVYLVETLTTISVPEDSSFKIKEWVTADEIIQMLKVREPRQFFEKAIKFIDSKP